MCLTSAVSDGLERLSFCTEVTLRKEIQTFEPLPSQLVSCLFFLIIAECPPILSFQAYPAILTDIQSDKRSSTDTDNEEGYLTLESIAR